MKIHTLIDDVSGDRYERFLRTMLDVNESFSLVWRDQFRFSEAGMRMQHELRNVQVEKRRTMSWPGTQLRGAAGRATMIRYTCADQALTILCRPQSLFSWRAPDFPEDLAFYDTQGQCTFASVGHERQAWVLAHSVADELRSFVRFDFVEIDQTDLELLRGVS